MRPSRLSCVDDRGAPGRALLDQHVHPVAAEERLAVLRHRQRYAEQRRALAFLGLAEEFRLVEHVLLHVGEILSDLRQRAVLRLQLLDQALDRRPRHLAPQLAQLAVRLAAPLRHVADGALQLLVEGGDGLLQPLALRLRQLLEILRAHHFVALARGEAEAGRRAHERHALLGGAIADLPHGLLLPVDELLLDLAAPRAVLVGLERRGNGRPQVLDQPRHVLPEGGRAPGRQLKGARPVRRREVEYVAPVGRRFPARRLALQEPAHDRVAADALRAHGEQVVSVAHDANPEADRLQRALLAERVCEVLQLVGGLELESRGVAAAAELAGRERPHGNGSGAHIKAHCPRPAGRDVDLDQSSKRNGGYDPGSQAAPMGIVREAWSAFGLLPAARRSFLWKSKADTEPHGNT
jgi:hypothetical protein